MAMTAVSLSLSPQLVQLGVALGVLKPESTNDQPVFNDQFFEDPLSSLGGVLRDSVQREAAIGLATEALGVVDVDLDLPDVPAGETWIPVARTDSGPEAGLYSVFQPDGTGVRISLGARVAVADPNVEAGATVKVPLMLVGGAAGSTARFLPGSAGPEGDLRVAATVTLPGGVAGPGGVGLDGLGLSIAVPTTVPPSDRSPRLSVTLRGLRLSGDTEPRDVSFDSSSATLDRSALEILVTLIQAQADATSADVLGHLLTLLGLGDDPTIPRLPLSEVIAEGAPALRRWFTSLVTDPAARTAWLQELGELLDLPGDFVVQGTGTAADPYRLCLVDTGTEEVCLTLVVDPDPGTGTVLVRPGVRASIDAPGTAPVPGRAGALAELCEVRLGPALSIRVLPTLEVAAVLGPRSGGPLVSTSVGGAPPVTVTVGQLRLGLALDESQRPGLLLEARDVVVGSTTYPVVNLTSADAITAATQAAETVLESVIAPIRDALDASPEARAISALAGLRRPSGVDANDPWPDLVSPLDFVANPVGAIGLYHARVLAQPGDWAELGQELGLLLRADGMVAPGASGGGVAWDPWVFTLFDNVGSADAVQGETELTVWSTGDGTPQLHVGLRTTPVMPAVDGKTIRVSYEAEIVRVDLPAAATDPVPLAWAPCHTVRIALQDDLRVDTGPVELLAESVEVGLRWCREEGIQVALSLDDPRLEIFGRLVFLPPMGFGFGEPIDLPDLDSLPWEDVELLVGQWLSSLGSWGAQVARFLGWDSTPDGDVPPMRLPQFPDLPALVPTGSWPHLSLRDLLGDPLAALRAWLGRILQAGPDGSDLALPFLGWLSSLLSGEEAVGPALTVDVSGSGTYQYPWAVGVSPDGAPAAGPPVELLVWLDPAGPSLTGLVDLAGHVLPVDVALGGDGGEAPPSDRLGELLTRATALLPEVDALLRYEEDVGGRLDAFLERLADSDGLVPADVQAPEGWATSTLDPCTHLDEPARFDPAVHLPGGPASTHQVFVSAALPGVAPWPGQDAAHTIDLTTPGLAPDAFDLGSVTGNGPWFVLLPNRASAATAGQSDTAFTNQVARLRRAVAAIRAALASTGNDRIALVAHSIAGHAARVVAAEPGVSDLVTLGTPHLGGDLGFLDQVDTASAVRLLQRLRRLLEAAPAADTGLVIDILDTLSAAIDEYAPDDQGLPVHTPFPVADFAAPGFLDLAAGTTARAVVGRIASPELVRSLLAFVREALSAALGRASQGTEGPGSVTHLGIGARTVFAAEEGASPGSLAVRAELRLDLHRVALAVGAPRPIPRLTLHLELARRGGWLVGGPNPVHVPGSRRDPRVRWLEADLVVDLDPMHMATSVTLHDASVFGIDRPTWDIDLGDPSSTGLSPEAQVLLGEVTVGISPLPASGVSRALADALAATGIVSVAADGWVTLLPDPVARFLADPASELGALIGDPARRSTLLGAVRDLLGLPESTDEELLVPLPGGFELAVEPGPPTSIELRTADPGVELGGLLTVDGGVAVDTAGGLAAAVTVRPTGGGLALAVEADRWTDPPLRMRVEVEDGSGPAAIDLYPDFDPADVWGRLAAALPAELLRLALEWAAQNGPQELVAVLDTLGLWDRGPPATRVRGLGPLLRDPVGWLTRPGALGDGDAVSPARVRALVDAVRELLGGTGDPGTIRLPWDMEVAVTDRDGSLEVITRWRDPVARGQVRITGELILLVGPGFTVTPSLAAGVRVGDLAGPLGITAAGLELAFAEATGVSAVARFERPAGALSLTLLPASGGFGALASMTPGAAVQAVLPLALDAVTELGADSPGSPLDQLGDAVAALGDALDLRTGGSFDADKLRLLAGDPAAEFRDRLLARPAQALAAFETITGGVLDAAGVELDAAGSRLTLRPLPELEISLAVPTTSEVRLCVELDGLEVRPGLEARASACLSPLGLASLELGADVTDEDLLRAGPVPVLPLVRVAAGSTVPGGQRAEVGLWVDAPGAASRDAFVLRLPSGGDVSLACRTVAGSTATDSTDLTGCALSATRRWLVPLLADLATALPDVETLLTRPIAGTATTVGELLENSEILAREGATATSPARYRLADGLLEDLDELGLKILTLGARIAEALSAMVTPANLPVALSLTSADVDGRTVYGVHLELTERLSLGSPGGVSLEVENDVRWLDDAAAQPGVDLLVVSLPSGPIDPSAVEIKPWIRVSGVGLRISDEGGEKLVDWIFGVESIALHGLYERNATDAGAGPTRAGSHLALNNFSLPLGRAGASSNPVAGKLLSPDPGAGGDSTEVAPSFSPQLILLRSATGSLDVRFKAGDGDGPWWLPIQQAFGPIYVEQVGLGVEPGPGEGEVVAVLVLVDGGVSLGGLAIGVDDLSLRLPWPNLADVGAWQLGLAGLAVGYDSPGFSLAGGLRRNGTPPDYTGMVMIKAAEFGITAIGAYGVFPVEAESTETYTSLFVFGALSAPLGGPPYFFLTGIGGGVGVNRRLVLPPNVGEMPRYPLVAAMDGGSALAADPMGALETLGLTFPPERGRFWFAAGVKFTSFTLIECIAVLSVEVGANVQVGLLGLARAALPSTALPLAQVEMGLLASFSTQDMVLRVQAQLTDNSWLINESCRMTGGFALVIWLRTGEFVVTLGGYHPSFPKPPAYPDVPRLGFNWSVSDDITVKGESYFALTATCVMAGGRLLASADFGFVWGSFDAGVDAIVRWDPLFYDVHAWVTISGGCRIHECVWTPFGDACIDIRLTVSKGADLHMWGPKLRGRVRVDFGPVSLSVPFGPDEATNDRIQISWAEFHDKYLVSGDPDGETMSASVVLGLLVPDAGASAGGQPGTDPENSKGDTGRSDRPWRLNPEFVLLTTTRAASTQVHDRELSELSPQALDLGPAGIADIESEHRVTVTRAMPGGSVDDVTADLTVAAEAGYVPEGIWRTFPSHNAVPESKVRPAFVGARLTGEAEVAPDDVRGRLDMVEISETTKPLPFHQEIDERSTYEADAAAADEYVRRQPDGAREVMVEARARLGKGLAGSSPSRLSTQAFAGDRTAPPRLAPLTEGMIDEPPEPITVDRPPPAPPPVPPVFRMEPPRLVALLRPPLPSQARPSTETSTGDLGEGLPRERAPSLSPAMARAASLGAFRLELADPVVDRSEGLAAMASRIRTRPAGGSGEFRRGLLSEDERTRSLGDLEDGVLEGVPVTAGDVMVWEMPVAEYDRADRRPVVVVEGDQTSRLLVLDRAGAVLLDETGTALREELPRGTHRFVVAGLGTIPDSAPDATLQGWHGGIRLVQVMPGVSVGDGTVIRSTPPATRRAGASVSEAVVRGSECVEGTGAVTTTVGRDVRTIVVVVEATGAPDPNLDGLTMGLDGAERVSRLDGSAEPPIVVIAGPRACGLFAVVPAEHTPLVDVTVVSDERWELGAVAASRGSVEDIRSLIIDRGIEGVIPELIRSPLGASTLNWVLSREEED
jgi:large repetitive protein